MCTSGLRDSLLSSVVRLYDPTVANDSKATYNAIVQNIEASGSKKLRKSALGTEFSARPSYGKGSYSIE